MDIKTLNLGNVLSEEIKKREQTRKIRDLVCRLELLIARICKILVENEIELINKKVLDVTLTINKIEKTVTLIYPDYRGEPTRHEIALIKDNPGEQELEICIRVLEYLLEPNEVN